ncbi:MAG: ankyrin repeat domain-containing protein [Verrucomicrobiales bacterium]|nr:ankyrin repeat domain-containing protein [Verrucomicrobiales bacterium]
MGDTNAAAALLESNTNLAYAGENFSKLPLLEAAAAGNVPLVKRLIQLGADINATGDTRMSGGSQMTALHEAIKYNRPQVCQVLLESGANPNVMAFGFTTPLHLAFSENREEMANLLLDYGAEPFQGKLFSNDETTPFELAITRSNGRLTARMLGQDSKHPLGKKSLQKPRTSKRPQRGMKTSAEVLSQHGNELLTAAAQRGELEAVQALLTAGVSAKNANTNCPTLLQSFSLAANENARNLPSATDQWHRLQDQLKADYISKADANYVASLRSQEASQADRVAMMAADRWQKILEILIKNGADYDAFAATALGDANQASRLLSADKGVAQARDCNGQTPLHWALQADQPQMVTFWINAGTPLAATNAAGQTALHLAAANGKTEFVKALLSAHAPTGIHDTNGWTPLDAAIQSKQTDSIHLLLGDRSAPVHPERGIAGSLHEAAATGNIAALASLLETETNLEARNELGFTPLHVAGQAGQLGAAAFLIDRGTDVNARDPDGNTVLHQILLSRTHWVKGRPSDAWVERRKKNPSQEKFWRVYNTPSGYTSPRELAASVAFFLACGADTAATNHAGQTILQLVTTDSTMLWDYDRDAILPLLQQSGNGLNERDADGNTALHRLCTGLYDVNKVESMASLIASGANINATNNLGQTPLHLAAQKINGWDNNDPPVNEPFQLLVYKKADVNARDNEGRTPLDVVVASDSSFKSEATALLIKAGAKSNETDKKGLTSVHQALTGKWPWESAGENLQQLARAGADFSTKDKDGKTPLHYLAALGDQNPMFFIRGVDQIFINAKVDFNARDNDGNTPLHIAAKAGTRDVFDWLVKQGAGLDETNNAGETPRLLSARASNGFSRSGPPNADTDIFAAAREGKLDSLSALVKADPALVNATNQFNQTPLRVAVMARRTNVVEFLEQHDAQWDIVSAVLGGQPRVVAGILARQPEAIVTKNFGSSLLHLAAANGDVATTKILLDAKADWREQDRRGLSPVGVARLRNQSDVVQTLRERGATENIFDVAYVGGEAMATQLLKQDKSLALATNAMGLSVAAIAAGTGQVEVLKHLLDSGASSERAGGFDGQTPLHLAAIYNQTNTARLLIRRGAKVNADDRAGFTPLHVAALRGASAVAGILLKAKADPNQPMAEPSGEGMLGMPMMGGPNAIRFNQESPLHLAAIMCQTNMIRLLLTSGASVNATDGMGRTPLDLAKSAGFPPSVFWIQRSFGRMDPLGVAEPLSFPNRDNLSDQQKTAASLLENAGGKSRQSGQHFGQPPGFSP